MTLHHDRVVAAERDGVGDTALVEQDQLNILT
jgi:hypothetical protein